MFRTIDFGVAATNLAVLTVPEKVAWRLVGAAVVLVSSASVGNRQIGLEVRDDSDVVVATFVSEATQAASLTQRYGFGLGLPSDNSAILEAVRVPIAGLVLPEGWDLRAIDLADIDGAGDTLRFVLSVDEDRVRQ